jgi:hypothetical protein
VHRSVERAALVTRERLDRVSRVQSGLPQHLVRDEVANTGDQGLIHQCCFHAASTTGQPLQELLPRDRECVGAERTEDRLSLTAVVGEPHAAELPHVAVSKLIATVQHDDHAIVAVSFGLGAGPHQEAGHPEMQQERGTVGPCEDPLPDAFRFLEPATSHRAIEHVGRRVAKDRGVRDNNALDGATGGMAREEPPVLLDVGKLGHGESVSLKRVTTAYGG